MAARQKAPPYPRPVSPLNYEEIPTCPDTIFYDQKTDETEQEGAQRAAKRRRRMRANAEAYLKGDEIYIMTASLKGPFDKGWKNPWKRRPAEVDVPVEVPETSARPIIERSVKTAVPETCGPVKDEEQCIDPTCDVTDDIEFTQPPIVQEKPPTNIFKRSCDVPIDRSHISPVNARRIEDWLRTSDAYKTKRLPDIRSSPTPASREDRLPTPGRSARRPASAGGCDDNTPVGNWATEFSPRQDPQSSQKLFEESTQQTHESQHRAEAAILEQKIRSVHRIPPSTNLPAFEYKRAKRTKLAEAKDSPAYLWTHPGSIHAEAAEEPLQAAASPPLLPSEQPVKSSPKKPALSTETSKTTANHLPSAQVVSAVPALEGLSNAQSTAELLQPVKPPTEQAMTQRQDSEPGHRPSAPAEEGADPVEAAPVCPTDAEVEEDNTAAPGTDKVQTPARNLDTQALLGSVKPFAVSTIKKLEIKSEIAKTPATASKVPAKTQSTARISKRKKKASFAVDPVSDESQSSIKAGFQVRKQHTTPSVLASTKIAIAEGLDDNEDYDLDPPTSNILADSLPKAISFPAGKAKRSTQAPKSILKPRSQPAGQSSVPPGASVTATGASAPGTNGTYQSTTTSEKRDAQQPRQLDMFAIENGGGADSQGQELEQFDLDEVVADLGSYLGTWDVVKAAAQAGSG